MFTLLPRYQLNGMRKGLLGGLLARITMHGPHPQLLVLDDQMLRDIGMTRAQALAEAVRPLRDAPERGDKAVSQTVSMILRPSVHMAEYSADRQRKALKTDPSMPMFTYDSKGARPFAHTGSHAEAFNG